MTSILTDATTSIDCGVWRRVATTMVGATLWLAATGAVQAATFTVTNTADSGSELGAGHLFLSDRYFSPKTGGPEFKSPRPELDAAHLY